MGMTLIIVRSCITLLWLHHNHKISISDHKNGFIVSCHQSVGRWFMCFVVRIFWWNQLAIKSLLVSVSRWNSWLEPFRFHVNCFHFLKLLSFMWGRHNCVRKMVFQYYLVVKSHNSFVTVRGMKYTSQHCCDKTVGDKLSLYREWCFPNFTKSWWKKLLS